jgi:hypothetical protein
MSVRTATPEVPRTLRHLDTDKQWAERDTASKLYCTAVDAAHRLRGLADVLYCEGLQTPHGLARASFRACFMPCHGCRCCYQPYVPHSCW